MKHRLLTSVLSLLLVLVFVAGAVPPVSAASYRVTKPAEGRYFICPSADTGYALDIQGGNLSQQTYLWMYTRSNGNAAQIMELRHETGDWYTIRCAAKPSLCLNVPGGNSANGQQLWLWTYSKNDPSSLWRFADAGNGKVIIQNQHGLCLNYDNGNVGNGVRIHLWELNDGSSFRWKLVKASSGSSGNSASSAASKVSSFLSDARFMNGVSWSSGKRPELSSYGSTGCAAYAADYVKYVYGKSSPRSGSAYYSAAEIRAGDVVVVKNSQHWLVVLERNGNQLKTAEGNWGGKVVVSNTAYTVQNGRLYRSGKPFRTFSVGYHYQ